MSSDLRKQLTRALEANVDLRKQIESLEGRIEELEEQIAANEKRYAEDLAEKQYAIAALGTKIEDERRANMTARGIARQHQDKLRQISVITRGY